MGIFALMGCAVAILLVALVWTYLRYQAMAQRFARVIDVDREVDEKRREVAAMQQQMGYLAEQEAARRQREQTDHAAALAQREHASAAAITQREHAATHHLQSELTRLQATIQHAQTEQAGLAQEIAQRRAIAESEHAAVLNQLFNSRREAEQNAAARMQSLTKEYDEGHDLFLRLKRELSLLQDQEEAISFGLYKPTFSFETPEEYKQALDKLWSGQKAMIKDDRATICPNEWTVGGSKAEGKRMQKQLAKLMLRAFNGEAEAAVARVSWNNVTRMEERIKKALEAINSLGTVIGVSIVQAYADLALTELRLTYEYEQKKREVAEEQRELRERMKEEEKAQREAARMEEEAAKDEARNEKALLKARAELEKATGAQLDVLNEKIAALQASLIEAQAQKARAKSLAEQTKSGYVYIISNVGSFGENIYKIGMTRRLDPMDRVRELGDASVPFEFDVHALIQCDDAPSLENAFHRHFAPQRVNLLNNRKEFFSVPINEIGAFAKQRGLDLQLTLLAEAREYRETTALRAERTKAQGSSPAIQVKDPFPARLSAQPASYG